MSPYNLQQYAETIPFEGFDRLRLNDYEVDRLLGEYVFAAIGWVESHDVLVRKVVLTPQYVRAYTPEALNGTAWPEFIGVELPKGLYERALDLSAGPLTPFPVLGPPEDVKLFLGRVHRIAFPDPALQKTNANDPKHIVLNVIEYAHMRRWLRGRLDPCTEAVKLKTGFQGVLYEHEYTYIPGVGISEPQGRKVDVWISRSVTPGYVGTVNQLPMPAWDWNKHKLQKVLTEPEGTP